MRPLLLIPSAVLLAACSDDRAMTAPVAGTSPSAVAAMPSLTVAAAAQGKPTASFSSIVTVTGPTKDVFGDPGNQGASSIATCPTGSLAIGGAFAITNGFQDLRITSSRPNATQTAWVVTGGWYGDDFNGTNIGTFTATAICIK